MSAYDPTNVINHPPPQAESSKLDFTTGHNQSVSMDYGDPPAAPVCPAPTGADWEAIQDGDFLIAANLFNPGGATCPQWAVRVRKQGDTDWNTLASVDTGVGNFEIGVGSGTYELQAQWVGCACGTTDWSESQFVTMVN